MSTIEVDSPRDTTRNAWSYITGFFYWLYCLFIYGFQFLVVWYPLFIWRATTWPMIADLFLDMNDPAHPVPGIVKSLLAFAAKGGATPWS